MTTKQQQPPRVTKQERVYAALRERILTGKYGAGYRVVIDTLAEEFAVSALPVREAIRRLEAEGLVVYRANSGAQVTPADPELFDEEMTLLAVLEGYATALAAPLLTDEDLATLTELTDAMQAAMEHLDPLTFGARNQDFHAAIYVRCPNSVIVDAMRDTSRRLDAIRRTVFVQIPYRGAASIAEHRELIDLLKQRALATEIEAVARAHKLHTVESFREFKRENGSLKR